MKFSTSAFYTKQQNHLNLWTQASILIFVLFIFNSFIYFVDQRLLGDEPLWIKPIKFELSLIIHFMTLAILASLLSPEKRNGKPWTIITYSVVAAGIFEVLYIFLQAARGRESHFNNSTNIESTMYGLMGIGAVILVIGSFYLGYLLYREYQVKPQDMLLLSSALGLMIGSVLTLIIASYLSSPESAYKVYESTENTLRMPIFSWYLDGKDLRIPHFFATHMMQFFPLYGFWLSRKKHSGSQAKHKVYWSVGIYTVLVLLLFLIGIL